MPTAPKSPKTETLTIDLEPKWVDVCRMAQRIPQVVPELMPACEIADIIRQSQKRGAKKLIVEFPKKTGPATFTEVK